MGLCIGKCTPLCTKIYPLSLKGAAEKGECFKGSNAEATVKLQNYQSNMHLHLRVGSFCSTWSAMASSSLIQCRGRQKHSRPLLCHGACRLTEAPPAGPRCSDGHGYTHPCSCACTAPRMQDPAAVAPTSLRVWDKVQAADA